MVQVTAQVTAQMTTSKMTFNIASGPACDQLDCSEAVDVQLPPQLQPPTHTHPHSDRGQPGTDRASKLLEQRLETKPLVHARLTQPS